MNEIINKDCLVGLREMEPDTVNCCITSTPYFGLRDYGNDAQLGLESTPEEYVAKMVLVFREVKRVLKKDGTLWLNLGDSYAGSGRGPGNSLNGEHHNMSNILKPLISGGLKPKDLIGIPWMVAFALRADGWYLRQDIIWHKPNPMPESVTDRCTKAHEYIFLLSKSERYYYDAEAIKQESKDPDDDTRRLESQTWDNKNTPDEFRNGIRPRRTDKRLRSSTFKKVQQIGHAVSSAEYVETTGANKRSVWTVTTRPYSEAHFATFPERLIIDCIKAGCPENGIVLDPFMGAGTTALVARKLNRNFTGFELNPEYINIANKRLQSELGLFL